MKMNIAGIEYEGSPQEIKGLLETFGAKIPVEEEYRKVVGREPKVGDFVKFNESDDDGVTAGKYYEITEIYDDGDVAFINDFGSVNWAFRALFGEGEFEFFEKVAPGPEFEVGDYIVALSAADKEYYCTNMNMKLGKVIEICDDGYIKIEVVRHENDLYEGQTFEVDRRFFRKAYKEEVDMALPQNAIFTKLGRKPNEFKKGDIVRVVSTGSSQHKQGDIGEITEFLWRSCFRVKTANIDSVNWVSADDVKLVAPVESRVDL